MHPEVVASAPGACPKCGMALERRAPAPARSIEYVCPMHPEIVRSEPSACPICGMALEPREPAPDAEDAELRSMTRRFRACLALTVPVFLLAMSATVWSGYMEGAIESGERVAREVVLALGIAASVPA